MKELSIEEKAKAYDEALERAKKNYDTAQDLCEGSQIGVECFKNTLTNIFPELRESEDEKIRKTIIDFVNEYGDKFFSTLAKGNAIAWLEKQVDCSAKWEKNTADNKPVINHSVLMKTTHGIAEGYFVGSLWFQYRWSSNIKDSDVLYWMELYELEK